MCAILGYSKQGYYKQLKAIEDDAFDEYLIVGLIKDVRKIWVRGSGRGLLKALEVSFDEHKIKMGRDRFYELLRRHNLFFNSSKRRAYTTNSYHRFYKYPNIVKELKTVKPNQLWVSDITYIWLDKEKCFCYLFLITDVYSRKIIGYSIMPTLKAIGALKSLSMAIKVSKVNAGSECIHHSDRGVQYCCDAYVKELNQQKIKISMTENGDPRENAIAERVNRTIKEEFTSQKEISFPAIKIAQKELARFIDFYNTKRPHRSIGNLTPEAATKREGELKRMWKTYYKKVCDDGFT